MVQHGIDAYYVPLDEVGRRSWISGFSGSNGDVIITKDRVSFLFLFPLEYREEFELKIEEQFFFKRHWHGRMAVTFYKHHNSWIAIGS